LPRSAARPSARAIGEVGLTSAASSTKRVTLSAGDVLVHHPYQSFRMAVQTSGACSNAGMGRGTNSGAFRRGSSTAA
jgi:hypothetical protein